LRAELRDAAGDLVAAFAGDADFDFEELLLAGGYALEVYRLEGAGGAQGYTLTIDASVVAETRPDVSVGATAAAAVGAGVYSPGQLVVLTSLRARPVNGYAAVANRGNLPDTKSVRALDGNANFRVAYFGPGGNLTAALVAGSYRTPELESADAGVAIRARVTPDRRRLTRRQGGRTTILRRSVFLTVTATSTFDPSIRDAASIQVRTR
jgi:hypothetical protein